MIQNLETHLGVKLLHRTTRRISVTTEGAAYYERCVRILADVDEAEQSLSHHNNNPRGTLRVDTISSLAQMVLLPELPAFFTAYPDLKLELTTNGKPIDLLQEGVDVVLRVGARSTSRWWRAASASLLAIYASPIYLRQHGTPRTMAELQAHRCINYVSHRTGREVTWDLTRGEQRHELLLDSVLATNDLTSISAARCRGWASPTSPARWPSPMRAAAGWWN